MANKSKYHITFVSISEGADINDLESLLEQRFKLSPARASLFFLGEDKITTSSLEKAKKFREYFLKQGVVVRIAPAVKKRPYVQSEDASEASTNDTKAENTKIDTKELVALHTRLANAEELIAAMQHVQNRADVKIKRLQEALVNHQATITNLKQAYAKWQQTSDLLEQTSNEVQTEATTEPENEQIAEPQPKSKRKAVWRVVRDSVIIASLAAAWLFFSKDSSVNDLINKLPFIDSTPAISTALTASAESLPQIIKLTENHLQKQSSLTTALTAEALLKASEELQISLEGLIAAAEIQRCTDHQFNSDLAFIDTQLQESLWPRITAAQLLQYEVINKDTLKLVQLGANNNCNSAESNKVVIKLAFDAYIQQHLQ